MAAVALLAAPVTGCAATDGAAAPPPSVPTFAAEPNASTPPGSPTEPLPAACPVLLPAVQVDLALGRPVGGISAEVVGDPDPDIGRLERLTCRYGPPDPAAAAGAPVEISVSRYTDEAATAARVEATVVAERERGASARRVQVGPFVATMMLGPQTRLLVADRGDRSLAVSLAPNAVPEGLVPTVLVDLADRTLVAVG